MLQRNYRPHHGSPPLCFLTVEAMDLTASPRSPLCFPSDEATVLPASPRTPLQISPIPEFNLLVTPPVISGERERPRLVYSRRRPNRAKPHVDDDAAAADLAGPLQSAEDVAVVPAAPSSLLHLATASLQLIRKMLQRPFLRWMWEPLIYPLILFFF